MHASLRACTLAIYPAALAAALVAFAGPAAADDDVAARPSSGLAAEQLVAPERARAARDLEQELSDQLQALWATSPALHRGTTALYVADAVSGEVLFSVHEDRGLNPASNVKLVSTATALSVLGPDHRFRTRLYGAQPDAAGVIVGDLYLVGSHDMTFHRVDIENMATDLAAAGVTRVEGSVVLSDHATRDTLAQAGVKVTVTGTAHGRKPVVEVTPRTTMVDVDMDKLTTHKRARRRRARLRVSSQIQDTPTGPRLQLRLAGRIRPGKRAHYFRKVPRPSTFTGHVLHAALEDAGIEVVGGVTLADSAALAADPAIGVVELAAYESPTVRQLVARINKPSNNFLADRLIENVGAARYGGDPSMDKGVRAMKEFLSSVGIDPDQVVLDTGSGLSYRSSLSARQVAAVLRAAAGFSDIESLAAASHPIVASAGGPLSSPLAADVARQVEQRLAFINSLAVAGEDGTLKRRYDQSPAHGRVIGKTGTLTSVIALSGFVSADDDALVFAIMSNGHGRSRRRQVRKEHEVFTELMLDYLRKRAVRDQQKAQAAPPL